MRLLFGDEPASVVPEVYERAARRRVGTINRHDWHWTRILRSVNEAADEMDAPGTFVAVHRSPDGLDDGYVQYTVKWAEGFSENPRGEGTVHDLWGVDDAVERALWQYLFDIDLIVKWRAGSRPSDDPIRRTLHDVRAYRAVLRVDEQWIRLLDTHAALDARTYGPSAQPVTIGVHDPMFEGNCGAWTISADGVERTSRDPDVRVDITALGSAYLGGVSWRDLASSGEVDGADDALLTALDALFAVRPIPYCGTGF